MSGKRREQEVQARARCVRAEAHGAGERGCEVARMRGSAVCVHAHTCKHTFTRTLRYHTQRNNMYKKYVYMYNVYTRRHTCTAHASRAIVIVSSPILPMKLSRGQCTSSCLQSYHGTRTHLLTGRVDGDRDLTCRLGPRSPRGGRPARMTMRHRGRHFHPRQHC